MSEIPKTYNSKDFEDTIYKKWEESGLFNPDNLDCDPEAKTFTISMPPPNATGVLHIGHASALTYEDLMIRYNRLLGKRTLYVPGEDHASIATQTKVEKILQKEGTNRHELGREKFLKRIGEYVETSRETIRNQTRKMGTSCDWSRERFTLDAGLTKAVQTTFINMFNDDLVFRGDRIVNWCTRCHSPLADDEVEYEEHQGKLYYIKYGPFSVATTRPITKIADTAVAVNPKDKRYKEYVGKELDIQLADNTIKVKVITDHEVDMDYGSGALGVTPAHSQVDYELAQKNDLDIIKLIDEDGKITEAGGKYKGMDVDAAEKAFIQDLKDAGQLEKEEDLQNKMSVCYRCETPIQPLTSLQWFIDVDKTIRFANGDVMTLKDRMLQEVRNSDIEIIPKMFEKSYFSFVENLRPWCVSRQIVYGHRIPIYYCKDCDNVIASVDAPKKCDACKSTNLREETDTLDTWFSSGLWTFSTLGWPDNEKREGYESAPYEDQNDLERFHPTSVMETGYDIIFFWVARMILMSTYCLGEKPFEKVYLHGMVRDKLGRKMSKSLGNGIDPLDMIDKYGADALRVSLIVGSSPGSDLRIYDEKIEGARNFVNKLWNISRYVLTQNDSVKKIEQMPEAQTLADYWILNTLNQVVVEVTNHLDKFEFSAAGEVLRNFTWNDFADWYVEISKLQTKDEKLKDSTQDILLFVLQRILIMWHPFMPYITEVIWEEIDTEKMILVERWPEVYIKKMDTESIDNFATVKKVITAIRTLRADANISPAKKLDILIHSDKKKEALLLDQKEIVTALGRLEKIEFVTSVDGITNAISSIVDGIQLFISVEGVLDIPREKKRIQEEIDQATKFITQIEKKLANKGFTSGAPKEVIEKENMKLDTQKEKVEKLESQLKSMK